MPSISDVEIFDLEHRGRTGPVTLVHRAVLPPMRGLLAHSVEPDPQLEVVALCEVSPDATRPPWPLAIAVRPGSSALLHPGQRPEKTVW